MKRGSLMGVSMVALVLGWGGWGAAQEPGRNAEELFKTLDKNADGVLKKDEVGEERVRFFERLVRVADKDSNGELSKDEFLAGTKAEERTAGEAGGERPAEGRPAEGRPDGRRLFERFDANKDGKVSKQEIPEEFRNRLNPVFERLKKEELTQEEFTRAMAQFARPEGGGPPAAEIEAAFRRADANGDGKVTLEEAPEAIKPVLTGVFRRLMREPKEGITLDEMRQAFADRRPAEGRPAEGRPPEGRPGEGRPGEGPRPMPRFFQLADANGDGRVSKEELGKLVEKFGDLDENKDGQLDPRELLGAPPPPREGRPEERRPEGARPEGARPEGTRPEGARPAPGAEARPGDQVGELFRRQDKNGDGKISKDEAENRLKENFDRLDGDKDGVLTREEIARGLLRRAQEGERPRPEGAPKREGASEQKQE